jgi:hypothetical protein
MNSRSSTATHMNHVTPIHKESDTADSSCLAAAGVATSVARRAFVARVTLCGDGRELFAEVEMPLHRALGRRKRA